MVAPDLEVDGGASMAYRVRVQDILGTTLSAIDRLDDQQKNSAPVQKLKREMLRTIALLSVTRLQVVPPRRAAGSPDEAA